MRLHPRVEGAKGIPPPDPPSARFAQGPSHVTVEGYPKGKQVAMPTDVLIINLAVLFAVREALARVLEAVSGFAVVGLASDGDEAVELAHRLAPDVVLMDLRMPNTDGVAATRRLSAELPKVKVVILTTFADDSSIIGALEAGAMGYLTNDAGREADRPGGALRRRRSVRPRSAGARQPLACRLSFGSGRRGGTRSVTR
jgi:CheY-like chemotaxis protein